MRAPGGEEFAIFLPNAPRHKAVNFAEAILPGIAALSVEYYEKISIQLIASLGFAPIRGFTRDSGERREGARDESR